MTKVELSDEEISEFKIEAEELLDQAEQSLLDIDKGGSFQKGYDAIFRAFHSVKGAAGMLNWTSLQHHMHQLETHFQNCKIDPTLSKQRVTYFLNGVDGCRKILDGIEVKFIYELPASIHKSPSAPNSPDEPATTELEPEDSADSTENITKDNFTEESSGPNLSLVASNAEPEIERNESELPAPLVFIIDDEPDIVDILSDMLSSATYEIKGYTKAMDAINAIEKLKPQCVFTDMNMPEMTGFEVLKKVHAKDPDIPVIFVSAHLTKQLLIDALGFGVFGAIEKPFNESQILNICKIATKRYQLWNLLNRSINFVLYQYSGLEEYLTTKGLFEVRDLMVKEMQTLLEVRRQLREEKEKSAS
jgi:FixJ family two-component response regulator/HPt (histidine-containing phosphotransfer) domain-containing protein